MNLIDFHCDTLSECYNRKSELYKNDLHIDLERGKEYSINIVRCLPFGYRMKKEATRHTTILIMFTLSLKNSF